jgi:Metalloenzyme superfamily
VHSAIWRFAALFVLASPIALSGATSGAASVRASCHREGRPLTTSPPATAAVEEERAESAVVLVVLDGVRWQEVFGGADRTLARQHGMSPSAWANPVDLMPNLHRIIDSEGLAIGAPGHGAEITASGPQFISLPGYIEIFAGKPDLGCFRNDCVPSPMRTISDQVRDAGDTRDVALVASWPNIARAASTDDGFVLTAGRKLVDREDLLRADGATSHLLDQGSRAPAFPGQGDYRPDAYTSRIALRRLAVSRPRFLFVGLGDADEYAHRNDYAGYLRAMHASDAFLGDLTALLRSMGARGRHTTVLVTADHGRARNFMDHGPQFPESGRVWLVAAGADVLDRGLVAATRHTLSDVAPTVRALLGIGDGDVGMGAAETGRPPAAPIPEIVAQR